MMNGLGCASLSWILILHIKSILMLAILEYQFFLLVFLNYAEFPEASNFLHAKMH
jgi:hypothetical protein